MQEELEKVKKQNAKKSMVTLTNNALVIFKTHSEISTAFETLKNNLRNNGILAHQKEFEDELKTMGELHKEYHSRERETELRTLEIFTSAIKILKKYSLNSLYDPKVDDTMREALEKEPNFDAFNNYYSKLELSELEAKKKELESKKKARSKEQVRPDWEKALAALTKKLEEVLASLP